MQICQDLERIGIMNPISQEKQFGLDKKRCTEVQYAIKKLQNETLKFKAFNSVNLCSRLSKRVKKTLKEERNIRFRTIDIKAKIREVKSFLRKRKDRKAKLNQDQPKNSKKRGDKTCMKTQ